MWVRLRGGCADALHHLVPVLGVRPEVYGNCETDFCKGVHEGVDNGVYARVNGGGVRQV